MTDPTTPGSRPPAGVLFSGLSLAVLAVAASAPTVQAAPLEDSCQHTDTALTCRTTVDGGELSIRFGGGWVQGFHQRPNTPVHLEIRDDSGWHGPHAGRPDSHTGRVPHRGFTWRVCVARGCTDGHSFRG